MTSIVLAEFDLGSHQMIRRRAVAGLSLLSALIFCAFVAPSAHAIVTKVSQNTTSFTCISAGGTGDFKDAHCDEKGTAGKEAFKHEVMAVGTTTNLNATNKNVTNGTKDHEPVVIKGTIGLAKVTIECTTMKTNTANSFVHNVEP
ncbi:MAG: hypothetical protein WBL45_12290, partial [Solirubrobacterales bacterium]